MTNTNNEFLRPCDIEEGKDTSRLNNAVFNGGTKEEIEALLDECEKCPKYSQCNNVALLNDRLKFLEYAESTDKNEQWEILTELFPIQEMEVEQDTVTPTEHGNYNKYNVRLRINGVDYKAVFHDSIWNYVNGTRSADVEIFACFLRDKESADEVEDLQEFCEMFGYEIKDLRKAQRAYRECKRTQQYFNRVLIPDELQKLSELLIEWGY